MGLLDSVGDLFGSGGSSTVQNSAWNPRQQEIFNKIADLTKGSLGKAATSYPKQLYADTNANESWLMDYALGGSNRLKGYNTALSQAMNPAYDVSSDASEKYWQNTLAPVYRKQYTEDTLPLLQESFAGPSFWSSARSKALNRSLSDYNDTMAGAHSNLLYQDELARRTALENAASRTAQIAPMMSGLETSTMGTAGALARQIEQEKIASDLYRWQSGEEVNGSYDPTNSPYVQLAMSLLGLNPYVYSQETSGPGLGYSLLTGGSGSSGGSFGGNLISSGISALTKALFGG